ncbi:conjugal transfer protein TrbL family protein [Actinomadura geliboluensis]|uniref:conjugal transfer protein TrbL family protein n=1 Tax=Actinomadura geliboluensis TaxID=882440 RepID=UPI0026288F2E|nr:conjugal transfer protein TrbL family protein [Actinomadura geliboluensis]
MDWIGGKLKGVIEETINDWVEEFMNWLLVMINELIFKLPQSNFVDNVMTFFVWFTGIFAVVIALYKIIEYIINTQNGTQEYPLDEILLRVIKSAGAILVLPWAIKIIMLDIALPIANYFASAGTDFEGQGGYTVISAALMASPLSVTGSGGIVLTLLLLFFVVVFLMFLYSVCVFYADYVVMQILVAPVSLSMIADDNNYFQVWWRELLSIVVSLLVKVFLFSLIINTLFTGGNTFLAIGAGALIIKSPSVLKNMWYGGGGSKALSRGMGSIGSMGSRMLITKFIK